MVCVSAFSPSSDNRVMLMQHAVFPWFMHRAPLGAAASDEEWASYNFSALRNLNKLRFELPESLTALTPPKKEPEWTAVAGVPRLLACFSRDLPLRDGIEIDVQFEGFGCTFSGRSRPSTSYVVLQPEIEVALLRFDNLNRVTLRSKYTCDIDVARAIGAAAFPTLLEAGKEIRVVEPDMHECW